MDKTRSVDPENYANIFIGEVLSIRRFVRDPRLQPAYIERAKDAERLGKFLTGFDGALPPPLPGFPKYVQLAESLARLALRLREQV